MEGGVGETGAGETGDADRRAGVPVVTTVCSPSIPSAPSADDACLKNHVFY